MWPFLPKECNCTETPNNPGTSCNHTGLTASDLIYEGVAGECSGITPGMTASDILQQLSYFLCSIELTQYLLDLIQENPEEYPEFIELVNGAINCETIYACGPVPTTTTTTTINCIFTGSADQLPNPTTTSTTTSTTTIPPLNFDVTFQCTDDSVDFKILNITGGVPFTLLPSTYLVGSMKFVSEAAALANTSWTGPTIDVIYGSGTVDSTWWLVVKDSVGNILTKSITSNCYGTTTTTTTLPI